MKLSADDRRMLKEIRESAKKKKVAESVPKRENVEVEGLEETKPVEDKRSAVDKYVDLHGKNPFLAFLVVGCFGPIGYLYVNLMSGLIALVFGVLMYVVLGGAGLAFAWVVCMASAPFETISVNKKLRAKAEFMASGN